MIRHRLEGLRMSRVLNVLYLGGIIAEIVIRLPYERQRRQIQMRDQQVSRMERGLLGLLFLGMFFIPIIYIFTSWLDRANYRWSEPAKARAGWIGSILLGAALWLFWRSHVDLGQNWSPSLEIGERQTLVTRGVYERIRHPMYASHWLWSAAQALILQNRIAGPIGLLSFLTLYLVRVPREEQMMIDHFGGDYHRYMTQTGRVVPRIRH
jgi:protein-S-isoprenylcysteine O-methyltransferase Ste14